jgi:hypothetical protein
MENLPIEIISIIASLSEYSAICKLSQSNKCLYMNLSDEKTWENILFLRFKSIKLDRMTARQSYPWFVHWNQRFDLIFNIFWKGLTDSTFDFDFDLGKSFFTETLLRIGPSDYTNMDIVWPQMIDGPYILDDPSDKDENGYCCKDWIAKALQECQVYKVNLIILEKRRDNCQIKMSHAKTKLDKAKTKLDKAKTKMNEAQTQLDEAQVQLDTTQTQLDTTQAQLDTTQAQLDTTQAQLDTTQAQLDTTEAKCVIHKI